MDLKCGVLALSVVLCCSNVWAQEDPVRRPGSVDIENEYDLDDLRIPKDEIQTLLPRDAIPALTDPKTERAGEIDWLVPQDRVVLVEVDGEVLGAPFRVLDWHEVINTTLGGEPIAVTYCPLCDSASVFSRKVDRDGEPDVLEFGVSGALYNSNVLMYDRTDKGLWSQVGMRAVSGPMAGSHLAHLPVRVVPWERFVREHPDAPVVSKETGHERPYETRAPYESYFADADRLLVPVKGIGDALPRKTLGVGIVVGEEALFVSEDAIGDGRTVEVGGAKIELARSEAGVEVLSAPDNARTVQTFYYSWSAFFPETRVRTAGE